MPYRRFLACWLVLACSAASAAESYTFHHDHILGTSLEIRVQADSEDAAQQAEARILAEIGRLAKIFSTYDAQSEFSEWQQTSREARAVSLELFQMLAAADRWRERSEGAFEPAVDTLSRLWKEGAKTGQTPEADKLAAAVKAVQQRHWRLDPQSQTAEHLSREPLTLNAIAKGAIVEWACQAGMRTSEVHGLTINLGGDLRVAGDAVQQVAIADPRHDAENAAPLEQIFVANRAVATSGGYRRGFKVGDQWHSHILDPRSGQPVTEVLSATVVAESSADADALATICNVLDVRESLQLVAATQGAECLIVTKDGRQHRSAGWSDLTAPRLFRFASSPLQFLAADDAAEKKDDKPQEPPELLELLVKIELNRPSGGQYRRPYVAVWLEDEDEFPVRTALLFMQTKQPGPRWHRDLLRWYRNDGVRKLADNTELIGVVSAATRGPGEYKAVFDGRDDAGQPLKPGKYTLYIEAAREHGTYQLIRHPLTLGKDPLKETSLKSNVEIKSASVEYRPAAAEKEAP